MRLTTACLAFALCSLLANKTTAGTLLVANKSAATLSLLSFPGGRQVGLVATGEGPHEVAISLDGTQALVTNYGTTDRPGDTLTLVDIATARATATIELPTAARPHGVEWLDDRHAVVTAEGVGSLLIVDVVEGIVRERIPTGQRASHMVAVSPDRRLAFVANTGSGSISVIDLAGGRHLQDIPAGAGAEGISLASNGAQLWVTNRDDDSISIFSTADMSLGAELNTPGFPIRAEPDPSRGRIYIALPAEDAMAAFATASRERTDYVKFKVPRREGEPNLLSQAMGDSSVPVGMQLAPEHSLLFVAHTAAHVISAWDTRGMKLVGYYSAGREPDGMGWTRLDVTQQDQGMNDQSQASQ